jgi:outer membrane immunogenic protein
MSACLGESMKRLLFAGVAVAAFQGAPALAADMPAKAAVHKADARFNWTGVYAGVRGGYGWNALTTNQVDFVGIVPIPLSEALKAEPNGVFLGAQIGANYEFSNHIVVGVAADISRGRMKAEGTLPPIAELNLPAIPVESRIGTVWTVTGKLGYAFDNFMIYATGGFASAKNELILLAEGGISTGDVTHKGWVAGVGTEFRLIGDWRLGAEYRYLSLGTEDYCFQNTVICAPVKWRAQQGLVTLNYQF